MKILSLHVNFIGFNHIDTKRAPQPRDRQSNKCLCTEQFVISHLICFCSCWRESQVLLALLQRGHRQMRDARSQHLPTQWRHFRNPLPPWIFCMCCGVEEPNLSLNIHFLKHLSYSRRRQTTHKSQLTSGNECNATGLTPLKQVHLQFVRSYAYSSLCFFFAMICVFICLVLWTSNSHTRTQTLI